MRCQVTAALVVPRHNCSCLLEVSDSNERRKQRLVGLDLFLRIRDLGKEVEGTPRPFERGVVVAVVVRTHRTSAPRDDSKRWNVELLGELVRFDRLVSGAVPGEHARKQGSGALRASRPREFKRALDPALQQSAI